MEESIWRKGTQIGRNKGRPRGHPTPANQEHQLLHIVIMYGWLIAQPDLSTCRAFTIVHVWHDESTKSYKSLK
jgi:hypothetical protein